MAKARNRRHVGLFVEGVNTLTSRSRDDLAELWRHQCSRLGRTSDVAVYGFSKHQLVLMDPGQKLPNKTKIPLDVFIKQKFDEEPFDVLIIAFDAEPENQAITTVPEGQAPCLRLEKDFVLTRLADSSFVPERFRRASRQLLAHYERQRATPRPPSVPPIGAVELVYMAPMFEDLILHDRIALRDVFGLSKTPKSWPELEGQRRPDFVLKKIVDAHRRTGPKHLRVTFDAAKHAWALEVLRKARENSPIWTHPIAERVRKVVPLARIAG